jgi:hypothetical protein
MKACLREDYGTLHLDPRKNLSSRPERSGVEGPCVTAFRGDDRLAMINSFLPILA